jgi:taurine dehydrogenase small subunit|tara:strand:+ start:140 stop:550 length:411 start_codon:yes stop_codon:yes gene_type:complete
MRNVDNQEKIMSRPITIDYLEQICQGFNQQDVDGILSHFSTDCVWLMARGPNAPEGRRCIGKEEISTVLRARYVEIPDMRWEEMRHWVCDETKAISEWIVRGTPGDGAAFEYLGCDLWEFEDGLVTKKDTYWKFVS